MSVKIALLAAAAAMFATGATAQDLVGRWTCHENMNRDGLKGSVDSVVDFRADGTLVAAMAMSVTKVVVPVKAQAKYRATWKLVDGKLIETPQSVTVSRFDVAGIDAMGGDLEADFKADMMSTGTPPTITFSGADKMEMTQPGRVTTCTR